MLEIENMPEDGADSALEAEHNVCVEKAEELTIYMSGILKKQRTSSIEKSKCDYYIDTAEASSMHIEEMH